MNYNAIALSVLCLVGAAPEVWGQTPPSRLNCNQSSVSNGLVSFCELREVTLPASDHFALTTVNGSVSVQAWDQPNILVRAKVVTGAVNQWLAETLAGLVVIDTTTGNVVVTGPSTHGWQSWSTRFEVFVPAATALDLTTVNGSIAVTDVTGSVQVKSVNGSVTLHGLTGDVRGNLVNGSVLLAAGDHWAAQSVDLKTVNGAIEIDVPADCKAHVSASVTMGTINTNLAVQIPVGFFGRSVSFDVGGGGSSIRLTSTLGTIQFREMD